MLKLPLLLLLLPHLNGFILIFQEARKPGFGTHAALAKLE